MKLVTLYENVDSCVWCGSDFDDHAAKQINLCRKCFYSSKEHNIDGVKPGPEEPPTTKLAGRWSQRARLPIDNAPPGINTSTPS